MSILRPRPVPASQFTWYAPERRFIAEISDIGGFGQVYDDACDEGLTLVSRYPDGTEHEIVFAVDRTEVRDGDLLYWDLIPADRRPRSFAVRVYND